MKKDSGWALKQFLAEGDEDYIGLFEIIPVVAQITELENTNHLSAEDSNKLLQAVLAFIILMLHNGFEGVDLAKDGTCMAWSDQSPEGVSKRLAVAWKRTADNPISIGFSFWFNKTNKSP